MKAWVTVAKLNLPSTADVFSTMKTPAVGTLSQNDHRLTVSHTWRNSELISYSTLLALSVGNDESCLLEQSGNLEAVL